MAKQKKSVLNRQRPRKTGKKSGFFAARWRPFVTTTAVVIVLVSTFFYFSGTKPRSVTAKQHLWKVSIKSDDRSLLNENEESSIIQAIKAHASSGDTQDLKDAVASIKSDENFAKVHLIRTGIDHLTVYYSKRKPIMCFKADHLYYISAEAEIYGNVEKIESCPGPIVTGILDDRRKYSQSAVLKLSKDEQRNVDNTLSLVKTLLVHNHQPSSITHEKYRGFYINLVGLDTVIALGNPPFDAKLEKLAEVLEKIKSKGEVAARIELDFQGKAFIKLKKL